MFVNLFSFLKNLVKDATQKDVLNIENVANSKLQKVAITITI